MITEVNDVWFGFLMGLALGLGGMWISRWRANQRLQRLLRRIERHSASPHMPYESQIASAIATQDKALTDVSELLQHCREMLQQAPLGYLYIDEENRLLDCNAKAQLYLDIGEVSYSPPRLLLAVARSYELDQLIEVTRQQQQTCSKEWVFYSISPDPSNLSERPAYPLRGHGVPLPKGHVAVFLENRREAVALIQQRDRWTSDVTHELKTPLTSIRLVAETLRNRVDQGLVSWVDRLLSEVMRLSQLVDDVLDLNQLDQASPTAHEPESTDIVALIHQAWENVQPLADQKRIQMVYSGIPQTQLKLHRELIHRLLINLLDNAIKYSPENSKIQVRTTLDQLPEAHAVTAVVAGPPNQDPQESSALQSRHPDGSTIKIPKPKNFKIQDPAIPDANIPSNIPSREALRIDVIDAGTGFVEKDLPFVFDRFYRSDLARSRSRTGTGSTSTGLGLSIVRKIVTVHRGHVTAQNHPDTAGAWLKVWLPTVSSP